MSDAVRCPVAEHSVKSPDAVCAIWSGGTLTYAQMEQQVRFFISRLLSLGVKKGERVALLSGNNPFIISIYLALQRIEASALFLSLQLTPSDWSSQMNMAGVRVLVAEDGLLERVSERPETILPFSLLESEIEELGWIETCDRTHLYPDNESAIIFTSSTTGHKKGVVLAVRNFVSSAVASNRLTRLAPGDYWGVSLPFYHVGGLGIIFRTLFAGASSTFLKDFSPASILSELSGGRLTHLSLVPTVLDALIAEAEGRGEGGLASLRAIKSVVLAGAASSEALLGKVLAYDLPVLSAWGMTETTAHCTCMSLDDPRGKVSSAGKPFYHTSIRLLDDSGEETEGVGEIVVRGPTVCMGYLDPETPALRVLDGWLHTGDLGSIDKDGYLKICGRKDDMFISGGENIHAGEIESVIKGYARVRDVAVIPVPHPKWGQRPIIIAESRDGKEIEIDEIRTFLEGRIAKIKVPDQVYHVSALPRTAIGKIDYKKLKERFS
jgi:o-succinylbenzoate---CoA ligase